MIRKSKKAAKDRTVIRIIVTILIGCWAVCMYMYILNAAQNKGIMYLIRKEMTQDIDMLLDHYEDAGRQSNLITESCDELYKQDLELIRQMIMDDSSITDLSTYFQSINNYYMFTDIMIVDRNGNIKASANGLFTNFKSDVYDDLRLVFKENGNMVKIDVLTVEDAYSHLTADNAEVFDVAACSDLYAVQIDSQYELVIASYTNAEKILIEGVNVWRTLLQNEIIGEQGYAFVWSNEDRRILYYPEDDFIFKDISALGIDMNKVKDGAFSWNTINGEQMYVYTHLDQNTNSWMACAVSKSELINSSRFTTYVQWIIFALLAGALIYYVILLLLQKKIKVLKDFTGSGKIYAHMSRQHKLLIITVLITVILMAFAFYLQTLYLMSSWADASSRQTQKIESTISYNKDQAELFTTVYDMHKRAQLSTFSEFLSHNEDKWTPSALDTYSYILASFNIQILEKDGTSKVGTTYMAYPSVISETNTDETLNYAQLCATQDVGRDVCSWMKDGRRGIQPMTDSEGAVTGYVYIHYYSELADEALDRFSLYGTLRMVRPGKSGFVFAVDSETNTFFYYPDADLEGRDALGYGLTENQIKDNYCDYITINSKTYYATTDMIGTDVIFYVVEKEILLRQRTVFTVAATLVALILFLLIGMMLYTSREHIEMITPESDKREENDESHSPEYRMLHVLMIYFVIAAALFTIYSSFRIDAGSGDVLSYVFDGKWEPGFNVFALSASILILCRGGIVLFIISKLVGAIGNILPVRGGTILKMMASLITYVAIAFLLYQCMLCFGLNPTALMASAGIVSVVIGIGANSLVGDILAGIFLLMEGTVRVGDVVQIGDFRGYVMEMGIRMTKLFDMDTDAVKIIPNNEVRNVVHMTMRTAIVYSAFQIRYEERLENVERILREELQKVTNKSPLILDGPIYIGVSALGDSGVELKTATRCHESCRKKVEREVNHIVYTIFQKHGIDVPYPQVTVHPGDDATVEREFPEDKPDDESAPK